MYLIHDEQNNAILLDPACYHTHEKNLLSEYITQHQLTLQAQWLTHSHVDHILGSSWVEQTFNVPLYAHPKTDFFLQASQEYANMFGFTLKSTATITHTVEDGEMVFLGNYAFQVITAFGHADGSVCYYQKEQGILFTGDVLFNDSIGRSDLPTGNHRMLINNIKEKLLILPDDTIVYPGHGPTTTIGKEKRENYFLR